MHIRRSSLLGLGAFGEVASVSDKLLLWDSYHLRISQCWVADSSWQWEKVEPMLLPWLHRKSTRPNVDRCPSPIVHTGVAFGHGRWEVKRYPIFVTLYVFIWVSANNFTCRRKIFGPALNLKILKVCPSAFYCHCLSTLHRILNCCVININEPELDYLWSWLLTTPCPRPIGLTHCLGRGRRGTWRRRPRCCYSLRFGDHRLWDRVLRPQENLGQWRQSRLGSCQFLPLILQKESLPPGADPVHQDLWVLSKWGFPWDTPAV